MYRLYPIVLFYIFVINIAVFNSNVEGAVIVTAPANGTCLDVAPGNYTTLDSIVITEGIKSDLPGQTTRTLILTIPAGFEFKAGVGAVRGPIPAASGNISAIGIAVTTTTITVTLSVVGTNKWDDITISGIQVRATAYNVSGNILRLAGIPAGGNASIVGDAAGAGISHGYLESEKGTSVYSIANGNWTNPAIWSNGFVPSCIDTIFVRHIVTVDAAATARTLVIETTGHLQSDFSVTVDSSLLIQGNGIYTHNNLTNAATTIFKGTESFATTSTIIILRWHNIAVPFPTGVTGNFGNITFNQGASWAQQGLFAPARIKGTLTVSSGIITMDEGTGLSTSLTLSDVVVNNTGSLTMATGAARNLTLVTGNYTDTSTSATRSSMMINSQGNLNWTANGNVYISHSWSGYQHSGSNPGNTTININGNFTIAGGQFDINTAVDAPLDLTVSGNTTITGTPTHVRFIDSNTGDLTFTTTNLYINGGTTTELMGGSSPTGDALVDVTNDFALSGSGTIAILYNDSVSTGSLTVNTGRDLSVTDGELKCSHNNGILSINAGRNITVNAASGMFRGQINPACTATSTVNVTGIFEINLGTARISEGVGNIVIAIVEDLNLNNGVFYGIYFPAAVNNGSAVLTCNYINFTGGTFSFFHSSVNDGKTIQVNCISDINIDFQNTTDVFTIIALAGTNNAILDLNIGYHLTIGGNFPGSYFLSSASSGVETVDIGGNMIVNDGDVFFVGDETLLVNSHAITTAINGDLSINGGTTRLSTGAGTAIVSIAGNNTVTGGTLNLKHSSGTATMTIGGDYSQTGGNVNVHSETAATTDTCKVIVNGDFSQTAGTFNFDNTTGTGMAEHTLTINGANYTLDGSANITHANDQSANYVFGYIYFNRTGTTTYTRNSSTHTIEHVRQKIQPGTTVDASSSTHGMQMTSVASGASINYNALTVDGTLDMGDKILSARQVLNFYSRVTVNSGGRYRTSHTGGLYSGSNVVASSIDGYIFTRNRVSYYLDANATIEYYGTNTSVVTGIPNGIASGTDQKYGILEINFTGVPGSTWVYPETADEVYIRTSLVLTEGEFNLDDDHMTTNGGRPINIEAGATASRTNGFIRSETEDGSGVVKWDITSNSTNTIPFGYDASDYIPFTFQQTSGTAGVVEIGTYRTIADNTPFPPTVTHVDDVNGVDNSAETVDRFWTITVPGTATANLTYTYAPSEGTGIVSPRAQQWEPVTMGWFPPAGVQSNPTGNSTSAGGISSFNTWWTLSSLASPLPIELMEFEVQKSGTDAMISWITQTEINNDYFTIERSADGTRFEPIKFVTGAGTSTSPISYQITDKNPLTGRNYYRLKQTDYDGNFTYSQTRIVSFGKSGSYSVYPNPATFESGIHIDVPAKGQYEVKITDALGRLIYINTLDSNNGESLKITPEEIARSGGVYSLTVTGLHTSYSQKILLQK